MEIKTEQAWRPLWSTPEISERFLLPARWSDQPPTLHPQAARVNDAQSCTALFRGLSSHHQPSASLILFIFDYRGHAEGSLCIKVAYGCPKYKSPASFQLLCNVPQVKNR